MWPVASVGGNVIIIAWPALAVLHISFLTVLFYAAAAVSAGNWEGGRPTDHGSRPQTKLMKWRKQSVMCD